MSSALKIAVAVLLLLVSRPAAAEVADLVVWTPVTGGVSYVVPVVRGVAPEAFARRYLEAVKKSSVYGWMENAQKLNLSTAPQTFSRLPVSTPAHPNVGVILNRPNQMTQFSPYLPTVVKSFQHEGPRLFAIPVGLETALRASEMQQFRQRLNALDGALGIGGDDPHPQTYGQKDISRTQGDISVERDLQQMEYIREYTRNGKGRSFMVCGSHQRLAIIDGHAFHCDIGHLTSQAQRGPTGTALIEVVAEPDSELALAAGSQRFQTTNFHHAAVDPTKPQDVRRPPAFRVTAFNVNPDGSRGAIAKALELPDNGGFATQFHPEFRGSPEEEKIVQYVAQGWKMRGRYSPEAIIGCMEKRLESMLAETGGVPP